MVKKLKPGDKVKMVNCYEATIYSDRVWTVRSNPWELKHGEEVVLLEGKTGGFATKCLTLISEGEKQTINATQVGNIEDVL